MKRRPERHPNLAWREIDGEIMIISPEDSQVHELNETASWIWKHADGTQSQDSIAARLAAAFDVTVETAKQDVTEFIQALDDKRLLVAAADESN